MSQIRANKNREQPQTRKRIGEETQLQRFKQRNEYSFSSDSFQGEGDQVRYVHA